MGDGGRAGSSARVSVCVEGSSFGASVIATGEPKPVAGDTDETLEYRLLMLLSPTVDAVCGRDGDFSSVLSTFSGSTFDSWLMPGS